MYRLKALHYGENSQTQTNSEQSEITLNDIVSNTKKDLRICGDFTLPDYMLTERIKHAFQDAKARGIRIRLITEITRDNLNSCKQIKQFAEIKHLEKLVGNYAINDLEYFVQGEGNAFASNIVYYNDDRMVEQQKYVFENLWNNAITQHDKMSILEVGVDPEEIQILSDPHEIRRTYLKLINSAVSEISLIIATPNALQRNYNGGIISMLIDASEKRNVSVNLIIPTYDIDPKIGLLPIDSLSKNLNFKIKSIVPPTRKTHLIKTTFLIVDKKSILIIDVKDDTQENFIEAVGYATYHTSKSRTESYNFIFDTIWRQADLHDSLREANKNLLYSYQKLEEQDAMEKEFINIAAHELRTPSQSIIGYSELLKNLPERNQQYEEAILRNAERLFSLVTNMLNVARIESQTMKLNKTVIDLNVKIQNVIKDISQQTDLDRFDKIKIEFIPIEKLDILADKEKIFEVFANLVNNAIKFTK